MILSWEMISCLLMEYDVQKIHSCNHIFGTTNKSNHNVLCCVSLAMLHVVLEAIHVLSFVTHEID